MKRILGTAVGKTACFWRTVPGSPIAHRPSYGRTARSPVQTHHVRAPWSVALLPGYPQSAWADARSAHAVLPQDVNFR